MNSNGHNYVSGNDSLSLVPYSNNDSKPIMRKEDIPRAFSLNGSQKLSKIETNDCSSKAVVARHIQLANSSRADQVQVVDFESPQFESTSAQKDCPRNKYYSPSQATSGKRKWESDSSSIQTKSAKIDITEKSVSIAQDCFDEEMEM